MRLFALLALFIATPAFATSDFLAQATVKIDSLRSSEVLDRVIADPRAIFQRFQPELDSSSTIVRPVQVTGPADHPIMQVSIRKCVGFICQTVDLDALISLKEVHRRACDRSFNLVADLSRSSQQVSEIYDHLDVQICFKTSADGRGSLGLSASVNRGPNYSQGFVQGEMFKMLKLQVSPIVKAIEETLKAKENP